MGGRAAVSGTKRAVLAVWIDVAVRIDLYLDHRAPARLSHYALRSIDRHKDVAKSLGVNSSPRFLCIKDGQLMAHMRGKAALEEFKTFVYNEC